MRKLYTLVAWLLFGLAAMKTNGQVDYSLSSAPAETLNVSTLFSVSVTQEDQRNASATEISANERPFTDDPPTCRADFEKLLQTSNASPLFATFKAIPWHSQDKKPKKICWNFGDGKDTCIEYSPNDNGPYLVRHRYAEPGLYNVCIQITYFGNCVAEKCKPVQIGQRDECRADFERLPVSISNNPLTAVFKALPWHNNNRKPRLICWNFGDGRDTCIEYPNSYSGTYTVAHTYRQPGNYEVCVKILYNGGCEAHKCKAVQVGHPDECRANFERIALTSTDHPLVVGFKALPYHNNQKPPKVICWSFGDGQDTCVEYEQNFSGPYLIRHRYAEPGTYNVCVKILYYGGCEARICKTIVVTRPDECAVDFDKLEINSTTDPLNVVYKAIPRHNNQKKPKTICWNFGDGKDTCISYTENDTGPYLVRHTYSEPGTYQVCIKILYFGGCEARKCMEVIVGRPDQCEADFERLPVSIVNDPHFVAFKAIPGHNNHKKPKLICWRFGDGRDTCIEYPENYDGAYAVRHVYREAGIYEVCIKILYYGGCEASKCKPIRIGQPADCRADFERLPVSSNDPQLVAFKAIPWQINHEKPKEICWKFGDGTDTCIKYGEDYNGIYGVRHQYERPGHYEVCVKILYYGGCEARECKTVKVEGPGECAVRLHEISSSASSLVRGFYAYPSSSNDKRPVRVCWYFGDGTDTCIALNGTSPTAGLYIRHEYPGPGLYRVCVKILFDGGCIASDCKEVAIRPTADACGGFLTDSLISPRTFRFRGFSIHNPNDAVIGFRWTFGDGSSATGREVTHRYNVPGTYQVCLYIKTRNGCETQVCKKLVVHGMITPIIQLTPNPATSVLRTQFVSTTTETVTLRIVNQTGNVVRTYQRNATEDTNSWELDVSALAAGSYLLSIQSPNQTVSQLFIKQ